MRPLVGREWGHWHEGVVGEARSAGEATAMGMGMGPRRWAVGMGRSGRDRWEWGMGRDWGLVAEGGRGRLAGMGWRRGLAWRVARGTAAERRGDVMDGLGAGGQEFP